MRAIPAFAALALALPLSGLELDDTSAYVDMRLGVGIAPLPKNHPGRVDLLPPNPPGSIETIERTSTEQAPAFSVSFVGGSRDPVGLALGIEFVHVNGWQQSTGRNFGGVEQPANGGTPNLHWRSSGANLMGGIEASAGRHLHAEFLGFVGGSRVRFDTFNGAMSYTVDAGGWQAQAGVRAGVYWTFKRAQIGLTVDYAQYWLNDASAGWDDARSIFKEMKWSGIGGRFEIGYRLQ